MCQTTVILIIELLEEGRLDDPKKASYKLTTNITTEVQYDWSYSRVFKCPE